MLLSDEIILKVATVVTVIGLIGMIAFSGSIAPKEIKINEFSKDNIGEKVQITAYVEKVDKFSSSNTYFLNVNDGTGKTTVIVFESVFLELEKQGMDIKNFQDKKVRIFGVITEYKGSTELVVEDAKSIRII